MIPPDFRLSTLASPELLPHAKYLLRLSIALAVTLFYKGSLYEYTVSCEIVSHALRRFSESIVIRNLAVSIEDTSTSTRWLDFDTRTFEFLLLPVF